MDGAPRCCRQEETTTIGILTKAQIKPTLAAAAAAAGFEDGNWSLRQWKSWEGKDEKQFRWRWWMFNWSVQNPKTKEDRRSGGFRRWLGGLGVFFVCKCARVPLRWSATRREGGGWGVGGDNGVEVSRRKKEAEAGFVDRKISTTINVHTPLTDRSLLYTAGQAPRNEARKTSGIQEK